MPENFEYERFFTTLKRKTDYEAYCFNNHLCLDAVHSISEYYRITAPILGEEL